MSLHPPLAAALLALALATGPAAAEDARPVVLTATSNNAVAYWNEVANRTVNAPAGAASTPEERRPAYHLDLATVHVAVYDAVNAIDGRHQPYAIAPRAPAAGASMDAAAAAAAYGVLRALFPNRGAVYEAAYEQFLQTLPAGEARQRGLALGQEVAAGIVALRAGDGRDVALAPFVSSSAPGHFRSAGPNPYNRQVPFIKPFALQRVDQFRPAGPPPLDSDAYAKAFQQSKALGGTRSTARTAEQLETARFHTEPPWLFLTRNLGRFARSTPDVAEAARLMALIYVAHADAITACFEAKYHYDFWRPQSAIPLAARDGDPAWTPVLPTPNHPEYPAAHSCTAGALGEALHQHYGTRAVGYTFDSSVTGTTRRYATTDALGVESETARVAGGMHFAFSTADGLELGVRVARWVAEHHFGPRR